jgi:hypothetical protein
MNDYPQFTRISGTAAGTTVITNRYGYLDKVVLPATKTGTVTFYDCSTAAGTTAANQIMGEFSNAVNAANLPYVLPFGGRFEKGLVAVVGGTTDITVVWN